MTKKERVKKKPTLTQGLIPILFMVISLTIGVGILEIKTEPIIILSTFFAGTIAWRLGYTWDDMQAGIIEKISRALPATLILWSVGLLIGSWMYSGTVPMIIYYGVEIVNPKFLLVTAFLISAILSTITGTSWGSAGTIGVAIMGIAGGLAFKMIEGSVASKLINKEVYLLDEASLVANTGIRGQFEARMTQLIEELQQNPDIIVFIDEIHLLVGAGTE